MVKTTRLSRDGQHVIGFALDDDGAGNIILSSTIDGKDRAGIFFSGSFSRDKRAEAAGGVWSLGRALMLAGERDQILAAYPALLAEIESRPEIKMRRLISQRERLGCAISGALDDTEALRERGYMRDLGNIPSYDSPAYRAAIKALADFDFAHPEIAAKIKADKDEALDRHIAAD